MNTIRTIAAAIAAILLAAGATIAAHADPEEPTSLYAFAVQPNGCTPGYIHINHARGAEWQLAGSPVHVDDPSSTFSQPGGFQDEVTATALDGYAIPSNVQSTFYFTVYPVPASCWEQPTTPAPDDQVDDVDEPEPSTPTEPTPGDQVDDVDQEQPGTPTEPGPDEDLEHDEDLEQIDPEVCAP